MTFEAKDAGGIGATLRKKLVETKEPEPSETFGWKGDNLVRLFMQNAVSNHVPRPISTETPATSIRDVLVCQRTDPIKKVFKQLCINNFLGCPVMEGRKYVGFISMLDLVRKVNSMFWGDTVEAWVDFWAKSDDFESTTVDDIIQTPTSVIRDPAPPLLDDFSTFYALEEMVHQGPKRFPLTNREGSLSGILTQSMLISFVRQNKAKWGTFGTTPLRDLAGWRKYVHQCTDDETAINVFGELEEQKVGGVAIVDLEGVLIGALSTRDLRGVGFDGAKFHRLFRKVDQFKVAVTEDFPALVPETHYSRKPTPLDGIFVTKENTLGDVLRLMVDGNIHRIFVCDDRVKPKPIGVISQRDMLRYVLAHTRAEGNEIPSALGKRKATASPSGLQKQQKRSSRVISVD